LRRGSWPAGLRIGFVFTPLLAMVFLVTLFPING
jgi:hypothetical protein